MGGHNTLPCEFYAVGLHATYPDPVEDSWKAVSVRGSYFVLSDIEIQLS